MGRSTPRRTSPRLPPTAAHIEVPEPFMLSNLASQCDFADEGTTEELLEFDDAPPTLTRPIDTDISPRQAGTAQASSNQPDVLLHMPGLHSLNSSPSTSTPSSQRLSAGIPRWYYRKLHPPTYQPSRRRKSILPTERVSDLQHTGEELQEEEGMEDLPPAPQSVLKRKKLERLWKRTDPLERDFDWLNVSPRNPVVMDIVREDLSTLYEQVQSRPPSQAHTETSAGGPSEASSVVLVSPRNPIGLRCMEDWDSYIQMLDDNAKSRNRKIHNPIFPDSSSESGASSPIFDIDLGAFELVDSGMSAEALLSHDDPVIFHKDMPVHSVHHDTVETEMALASLMNAPSSMMSTVVPPAMVADNYCFIVDGDKIKMGDIMGDDQWWRHTSRPTKFFYSEDLKRFYRVNCITAKGKIISAKLASATPAPGGAIGPHLAVPQSSGSYPGTAAPSALQSYAATPRSSMSFQTRNSRGVEVPLENVYKVIRFYSFWRTCTSFHRIVTMIDKVRPDERFDNAIFGRRLFVQYLWRNAKASEKARVQKEFDPRRQRLLKFVTDPATRKKMTGADRPGTSRFKSTS